MECVSLLSVVSVSADDDWGAMLKSSFSKQELTLLVRDKKIPERWDESSEITNGILCDIDLAVDFLGIERQRTRECVCLLSSKVSNNNVYLASKNLRRNINRLREKSKQSIFNLRAEKLYEESAPQALGPCCAEYGIKVEDILKHSFQINFDISILSGALLLELGDGCCDNEYFTVGDLSKFISNVFSIPCTASKVLKKYQNLKMKVKDFQRKKKTGTNELLSKACFTLKAVEEPEESMEIKGFEEFNLEKENAMLQAEVSNLNSALHESGHKISELSDCLHEVSLKSHNDLSNIRSSLDSVTSVKKSQSKLIETLLKKVGKFDARNVNKRESRKDDKIIKLSGQCSSLQQTISLLEDDNSDLINNNKDLKACRSSLEKEIDSLLVARLKEQRQKNYFKRKYMSATLDENSGFSSKVKDLKREIMFLENELCDVEETLDNFLNQSEIVAFKDGAYTNEIRMVYEDLLSMRVGSKNCEKIIRSVLLNLAGLDCNRLPKETFAKYMLLEARGLSQIQVAETLLENWDTANNTLASDGTSKYNRSYMTYDITTDKGVDLCLGVRETSNGTAEEGLKVLQEVLDDLVDISGNEDNDKNKIMKSVKNLLSDRCTTQKKYNKLLSEYRSEVVPMVTKNWEDLPASHKEGILNMNQFFCGLHYIVGLADQAESALKCWDIMNFNGEDVGSLAHGGYSNGSSGTHRLIYTMCKAVQERGCQKSGRPVAFKNFLLDTYGISTVPLIPFKGNRFNVFFLNGAGVFSVHEPSQMFFEQHKDSNNLLKSVYHDLNVPQFKIGCQALGLIDKYFTGPLWRLIAKKQHVLDMNGVYQELQEAFKRFANDSSDILSGCAVIFPEETDSIYSGIFSELLKVDDNTRESLKQCLELIMTYFVIVSDRMLQEHSKLGYLEERMKEPGFREETQSVHTANIGNERSFGVLDSQINHAPKGLDLVWEGLVMFKRNKTREWRDNLDQCTREQFMSMARKSVKKQRALFFKRKIAIRKEKETREKQAIELKKVREQKKRFEKEALASAIEEAGGLWKSEEEILSKINGVEGNKRKIDLLKNQLQFRKKVLDQLSPDPNCFFVSSKGKPYTVKEIIDNLMKIISYNKAGHTGHSETHSFGDSVIVIPREQFVMKKNELNKKIEQQCLAEDRKKTNGKRSQSNKNTSVPKKLKRSCESVKDVPYIPISKPVDLVGKKVMHKFFDEDRGEDLWYEGVVLSNSGNTFEIRYSDGSEIFSFNLMEDFEAGDLLLKRVEIDDFMNSKILHMYLDDDTNEEVWWKAYVSDIDEDSEDVIDNPMFFVYYKDDLEEIDENLIADDEYYLCPLIEDYVKGFVSFL